MIKLYPKAQRYFVIVHRMGKANGTYYPTYTPSGGHFNQRQLHDALVSCCELYGVTVIDVYSEGIMDTRFSQYRSSESNWRNAAATDFCDADGVHPLAYGYQQAYLPLIRRAMNVSSRTLVYTGVQTAAGSQGTTTPKEIEFEEPEETASLDQAVLDSSKLG